MTLPTQIKALILDMDGVLWRGDQAIGDLPEIFSQIEKRGLRVAFATNNGTRTPEQYVERLAGFSVKVDSWQIITSAQATSNLLMEAFLDGGKVFAIGEIGLLEALRLKGFEILSIDNAQDAQAVVMGIDRDISFRKISEATLLVNQGIPFYATNPDLTFPTPRGEIPGAGAWVEVISSATGKIPIFAGKPAPLLLELARERLGTKKETTLVVGDRLSTDIAGGQAAGMMVALVLSGVSTLSEGKAWKPEIDIIANDLKSLVFED